MAPMMTMQKDDLLARPPTLHVKMCIRIRSEAAAALTKTSDADAPERKGNRSRNCADPFDCDVGGCGSVVSS